MYASVENNFKKLDKILPKSFLETSHRQQDSKELPAKVKIQQNPEINASSGSDFALKVYDFLADTFREWIKIKAQN